MTWPRKQINTVERDELDRKIADAPEWDDTERPIRTVHTHISTVFLGQKHVLKTKKPVDFGFLDYTTLEKRLAACRAEVQLNQRLCPDVYLRVQPISEIDSVVHLSDSGKIFDYGVLMKRLPAERMLDHMVAEGTVTESIVERVSNKLRWFHQHARRGSEIDRFGSLDLIRQNWKENFDQTAPFIGRTISREAFDQVRGWVDHSIEEKAALFEKRVLDGWIRDGHGDVRCESVCVLDNGDDDVCIYDCIEFNDRFRYGDVASEVAFLSMDLDIRGRPDLGYFFAEHYERQSGDGDLFDLLPFYKCYRAFVRGKVLSFRLDQTGLSEGEKQSATARARVYFDYAHRYASPLASPTLILVGGLSGTGKTSVARAIASELGLTVVSADRVRKSIYGTEIATEEYGKGAYGPEANEKTYNAMLVHAAESIRNGKSVILDATFRRKQDREAARLLAESMRAGYRMIVCELDPSHVNERLEKRAALKEGQSDATWKTFLSQSREFDAAGLTRSNRIFSLNTERPLAHCSREACDWLRSLPTAQPRSVWRIETLFSDHP